MFDGVRVRVLLTTGAGDWWLPALVATGVLAVIVSVFAYAFFGPVSKRWRWVLVGAAIVGVLAVAWGLAVFFQSGF